MESRDSLRVLHIASWYPSKVHESLGNFIQRHISAIATKHHCELWFSSPVQQSDKLRGTVEIKEGNGFVEKV